MINITVSMDLLFQEAKRRKIKVKEIFLDYLFLLQYQKHKEYLYRKTMRQTSSLAVKICTNKAVTSVFLSQFGISTAESKIFSKDKSKEALLFAQKIGFPVVIKNPFGTEGKLVYPNIANQKEFMQKWHKIKNNLSSIMVEKHIKGTEYRIFTTKKKVIAAVFKIPANIIGDGEHTISQLAAIKNKNRLKVSPAHLIKLGVEEKEMLRKQKLNFKSIPVKNKIVYLRDNANLSTGGENIDYTDKIHSSVKKIILKTINSIPDLQYAGIDIISQDITKKQTKNNYTILEINSYPNFTAHHFPYEGKPRNVAKEIIDILFPETESY